MFPARNLCGAIRRALAATRVHVSSGHIAADEEGLIVAVATETVDGDGSTGVVAVAGSIVAIITAGTHRSGGHN